MGTAEGVEQAEVRFSKGWVTPVIPAEILLHGGRIKAHRNHKACKERRNGDEINRDLTRLLRD